MVFFSLISIWLDSCVNQMQHKPQNNICFVLNTTEYYFNAKYNRLPRFYFYLKQKKNKLSTMKMNSVNVNKKQEIVEWNKCLLTQANTNRIGYCISIFNCRVLWFIYKHSVHNLLTTNSWKRKTASCTIILNIRYIFVYNILAKFRFYREFGF